MIVLPRDQAFAGIPMLGSWPNAFCNEPLPTRPAMPCNASGSGASDRLGMVGCWGTETGSKNFAVDWSSVPVTFPRVLGQVPLYYNHRSTGRPPDANNKFTSKYIDAPVTPRYPFGYGLSYTTFGYSNLKLSAARARVSDTITATVTVTNSGSREGTEVVQLYIRDLVSSVTRPIKELKGFQKISLAAGETKTVAIDITPESLAFYDINMKYVVEPGDFAIMVGSSSRDVDLQKVILTVEK